jgi:hypothetical protein
MSSTRCRSATCDGPHVRCVSIEGRRWTVVEEVAKHLPMGAQCKRTLRIPALVDLIIVAMACVLGSGTPTLCRCRAGACGGGERTAAGSPRCRRE